MLGGVSVLFGSLRWSFAVVGACMALMTIIAVCTGVGVARAVTTAATNNLNEAENDVVNPLN
jgi:uncharacterized membrane protein YphA (DoxX/SURF4 family)